MVFRTSVLKAAMVTGGLSLALAACDGGEKEEIDREALAEEIKADLKAEMAAEEAAKADADAKETPEPPETPPSPAPTPKVAQPPASTTGWRNITCDVTSGGDTYSGPCQFMSEAGGSFAIQRAGNVPIFGATSISVSIISPGHAEVRGLTAQGINSRWGSATRSSTDRACWDGVDFQICAR